MTTPDPNARIDALQEYLATELARIQGQIASDRGRFNDFVFDRTKPHYLQQMKEAGDQAKQAVSPGAADQLRTTEPTDSNDQGEQ